MPEATHLISVVFLVIGTALVLWGLRIFKVYVVLTGFGIGASLGAVVGGLATRSREGVFIGGLMGAILGAAVAWPLQKLIVFLLAGTTSALVGVAAAAALEMPQNEWWKAGLLLFVVGGVLALSFYEYVIIIVMAFNGAQWIFNADSYGELLRSGRGIIETWQYLIRVYSESIVSFLFTVAVFVWFSLHFQKRAVIQRGDSAERREGVRRFRRLSYLVALLAIVNYAVSGSLARVFYPSTALPFGPWSWPLVAVAASGLATWLIRLEKNHCSLGGVSFWRFFALLVFCHLVCPLIAWFVASLPHLHFEPAWGFRWYGWYWRAFFRGDVGAVAIRLLWGLFGLPGLLYLAAFGGTGRGEGAGG